MLMTLTQETKLKNNYPLHVFNQYSKKIVSPDEAVKVVKSNDKIVMHSNCAYPSVLVNALVQRKAELSNVEIYHALTVGPLEYLEPGNERSFNHKAFFVGANSRKAVQEGRADFIPIFLYESMLLYKKGYIKPDVALIHVSPPDEHGFCSYGVDVGLTKTGAEKSKIIIAQVNPQMPRTLGDSFIHLSKIDYIVEVDNPLTELLQVDKDVTPEMEAIYSKIGSNIAELIEDGSTLQLGIGAIPDAVLRYLTDKKGLGVHSETFSDGIVGLVEKGIVTNEMKTIHRGKIIAGFVLGSKNLFSFINNNPLIEFHPQEYINDPFVIAQNEKMVAINSAIEIDITGQVCSDSIGPKIFSGFGGQVDFIRGSARSEGGKPIIALPATAKNGTVSRIVPFLRSGAGVVTSRADVHYIVTEFGVAQLFGKSIRQRAMELINISHPDFREDLLRYARENKYI
jgi:acyl-CoA hydrolase